MVDIFCYNANLKQKIMITAIICFLIVLLSPIVLPWVMIMIFLSVGGFIISPFYAVGDWLRDTKWSPHWRLFTILLSFLFRDIILQLGSMVILAVCGVIVLVCIILPFKLYKLIRYG